jgi:ATP-dependent exoDNAse (exonuclease V) alpha subunit
MNVEKQTKAKPGAIYHFTCKVHGRSDGSNSVKLAAYRAGVRLKAETTGRIHNYSRKKEVIWSHILAPENAPAWARDRQALWNAVDRIEHRCDAQLAREVEVALPLALSPVDHCDLLREWIRKTFVAAGMVADVCYHAKRGNPHAHILLTLRDIDAGGFGKKNRSWNNQSMVESWRATWAEIVNRYLEKAGLDIRIDHRSFKRQGIDLTPTKHVGRLTPWNGEKVAEVSMENRLILIEREIRKQKREQNKAARLAAAQKPETQIPSPTSMPTQRPSRVRRQRPARVLPAPGFVSGSEPSF